MTGRADVVLIANNFPPVRGGSGIVYANLARFAAGRVIVVAPSFGYADGLPLIGWREHDRRATFRVARLPLLRTPFQRQAGRLQRLAFVAKDVAIRARLIWLLTRLICQERPRAACIGELLASRWLLRLLRFVPGLRTLVYVHGEEVTTIDSYDPDAVRRRAALLAADRIVVVSRFTQRAVQDLIGSPADGRIVLIENGVDTARFHPGPRNPELIGRYGLEGMFVFISICRLLEKKGVDHALRAFAELLTEYPMSRFLVVGTGPYEAELRDLVATLGMTDAVIFSGNVPEHELVEHYRLGDVFVMPNRALPNGDTEGFGLVFLEANGCGLPVIAGQDGGSTDAVQDGVNGLVVDGSSVPAVLGAMQQLRRDDALRERLARQALDTATAADWTSRTDAFLRCCGASGR